MNNTQHFRASTKTRPSSREIERNRISDQIAEYLAKGGTIEQVAIGVQTEVIREYNFSLRGDV